MLGYLIRGLCQTPILRDSLRLQRASRSSHAEHPPFPPGYDRAGIQYPAGRASDRPHHARQRALAQKMSERLLEKGMCAIGFSYPFVPKSQARIRVQLSAVHSREDLEFAMGAFAGVKKDGKCLCFLTCLLMGDLSIVLYHLASLKPGNLNFGTD